jgi:hypothetical protein
MNFRTFILPWAIALCIIGAIETAVYALYRPDIVTRNDFLIQPIQMFLTPRAERWIIWNKVRNLPDETPLAVQAGDSSGYYGIIPDVVSQYAGGKPYLNLSCCANQGFRGYLVLLELALRKYPSLRYAVVYVSLTVTLDESQWILNPPDTFLAPGVTLPMLAGAMQSNFASYRRYLYPPSNAFRPQIYERVLLLNRVQPVAPQDRQPNSVFQRTSGIYARNGYMIEHDLQIDVPAGCAPLVAPRDPATSKTYWELFAEEFVALARTYGVTPVIIFGPTGVAACEANQDYRNEITRLRTAFPSLRIPYDPIETWPANFFSVPAHVQRTFAIEASRRVGRALRALESGRTRAEDLAATVAAEPAPTLRIIGATLTEECGWSPDYRNGYYGDLSEALAQACEGKTACTYKEGSDPRDRLPPNPSCKDVHIVEYQCAGEPVRVLRQEGRQLFGGNVAIECGSIHYLARDPMPYGIQIDYATLRGKSGGVIGNATMPVAARCQGLADCAFAADVPKLGGAPDGGPQSLEIVYRCDRERATRIATVADIADGTAVHFGCTAPASPAATPIAVANATYGGQCGAAAGNADYVIATLCDGKDRCALPRLRGTLGEDAPACADTLAVDYHCGSALGLREARQANDSADTTALVCGGN